jgi:hypothetical protein
MHVPQTKDYSVQTNCLQSAVRIFELVAQVYFSIIALDLGRFLP